MNLCKCRLDTSVCNNKQTWDEDKCRCECKELNDRGICDKGFDWNPSNCECECGKSCDVGEYLDYKNCTARKTIFSFSKCFEKMVFPKNLHLNMIFFFNI